MDHSKPIPTREEAIQAYETLVRWCFYKDDTCTGCPFDKSIHEGDVQCMLGIPPEFWEYK